MFLLPAVHANAAASTGPVPGDIAWLAVVAILSLVAGLVGGRYLATGWVRRSRLVASRVRDAAVRSRAESDARYREIIESSQLGVQVSDRDGKRVFVNRAYAELAGFASREELLRAPPYVFVAEHERARLRGYREALFRGEEAPDAYEFDAVRKDGTPLRVQCFHTRIVWNGADAIQRTYVDLTDRKSTEDALRASEARLNNAQRIANIGDWQREIATDRIIWSDECYRIFGVTRENFQPSVETLFSLIHPDDRERTRLTLRRSLETGEIYEIDHRIVHPNGEERIIHERAEVTLDENGRPIAFAGTAQDVTELRRAEEALRASEARLSNAQRIASIGDWQRDYRTGRSYWSEEAFRLLGVDPGREASFDLYMSIVHPEDRAIIVAAMQHALESGTEFSLDHRIVRADGSERIIHEQGEFTLDGDGRPLLFTGTAQDVTDMRRVERGLAESEARFRSVIETGGAGIVLCDHDGRCALTNPEFGRFVGWPPGMLEGRSFDELVDPADAAAFRAGLDALRSGARSRFETECRMVHRGGERLWAGISLTASRDSDEGGLRFVAIVQDITGRKRAEAELARKSEMLDLARDMATATNLAASFQQAVRYCLDRICAYTGWPIGHACIWSDEGGGEMIPMGVTHIEDVERHRELSDLLAGVTGGHSGGFAGRVVRSRSVQWQNGFPFNPVKPGRRGPYLARLGIRLGVGAPVMAGDRVVAVLEFFTTEHRDRDEALCEVLLQVGTLLGRVYERETAAEALRMREMQLSQIIDNVPYSIYVKDEEGRYLLVNRSIERVYNLTTQELVGRKFEDIYRDDETVDSFRETEREVFRTGRTVYLPEEKFVTPDGSVRYWRTTKMPYTSHDGKRAVLGISFDITEEKQHQEQLRRAQRMDAIGQMTGGVAHDFNNLLTIILGNLQLLERRLDDETLRSMVSTAASAARRGAEVTRRLLAFARSQPLTPSTTVLNDLVSSVTRIVPSSLGLGVKLDLSLHEDLWPALVDPVEMENALLNLLLNARDAMPHGGLIVVSTENVTLPDGLADGQCEIEPGDYAVVSVSDTGVGMSEEVLARAVEPFFTTKAVGKGSGLGLSMAYGFARQSGGGIFMDSAPGKGTTIRIYLPRNDSSPEPVAAPQEDRAVTGDRETVLLVEDDPDVRAFTATALGNLNYRVIEAWDAAEGLKVLDGGAKVHLLFTDVMLPGGMDGRALAREARSRNPDLPVLFTSGNWDVTHPLDGEDWIANDVIVQKPYTQGEVGDMIRKVLNKPRHKS